MAVFDYVAIGPDGKRATGVITADSARSARKELRLKQLSPLDVKEAQEKKDSLLTGRGGGTMSSGDLVLVTRQLAMLVKSGATVEEALGAIANEAESAATRRTLMTIRGAVQEGFSLSEALSKSPRAFPPYYRAVVSAGLASGRLGDVLERLATHLEKSRKLRRKMMSALIYPAVLVLVATVVVALLMVFVVPEVVEQFDTLDQDLPLLTDIVIAISDFLRGWGGVALLIGIFVGSWVLRRLLSVPAIKYGWDQFLFRLPMLGKVFRSVNAAQFARTFATLSSSGATVPDALIAARGAVGSEVFRQAITGVRRQVEEGQPLHRAMRNSSVFPPMLLHMVASGERGDLPNMMGRAAEYMEDELDSNATVALGLIEPLMIVFLAVIVALIVLSIMLPILQLNQLAIGG